MFVCQFSGRNPELCPLEKLLSSILHYYRHFPQWPKYCRSFSSWWKYPSCSCTVASNRFNAVALQSGKLYLSQLKMITLTYMAGDKTSSEIGPSIENIVGNSCYNRYENTLKRASFFWGSVRWGLTSSCRCLSSNLRRWLQNPSVWASKRSQTFQFSECSFSLSKVNCVASKLIKGMKENLKE